MQACKSPARGCRGAAARHVCGDDAPEREVRWGRLEHDPQAPGGVLEPLRMCLHPSPRRCWLQGGSPTTRCMSGGIARHPLRPCSCSSTCSRHGPDGHLGLIWVHGPHNWGYMCIAGLHHCEAAQRALWPGPGPMSRSILLPQLRILPAAGAAPGQRHSRDLDLPGFGPLWLHPADAQRCTLYSIPCCIAVCNGAGS